MTKRESICILGLIIFAAIGLLWVFGSKPHGCYRLSTPEQKILGISFFEDSARAVVVYGVFEHVVRSSLWNPTDKTHLMSVWDIPKQTRISTIHAQPPHAVDRGYYFNHSGAVVTTGGLVAVVWPGCTNLYKDNALVSSVKHVGFNVQCCFVSAAPHAGKFATLSWESVDSHRVTIGEVTSGTIRWCHSRKAYSDISDFSLDDSGETVVVGRESGEVILLSADGSELKTCNVGRLVKSVGSIRNGEAAVVATDSEVLVVDWLTGSYRPCSGTPGRQYWCVGVSPARDEFTVSFKERSGRLRTTCGVVSWRYPSCKEWVTTVTESKMRYLLGGECSAAGLVQYALDGKWLGAEDSNGGVIVWDQKL